MFDEILHADGTIIHSTNADEVTKLLNRIEIEGAKYGLKWDHKKCEAISVRGITNVHFLNGDKVKEYDESKYLGCFVNNKTHAHREINKRMGDVFTTWKRLEEFWKHTDCDLRFKLIVYDAAVRAKVMTASESLQLSEDPKDKVDVFQRKGLRKINHHLRANSHRKSQNGHQRLVVCPGQ